MGAPIKQILHVIKQAKHSSVPGPDGFSAIRYPKLAATLVPHLEWFLNALRARQKLDLLLPHTVYA